MKTLFVIAILALLVPACAASVQEPVAPMAAAQVTDSQPDTLEVTVYDRGSLEELEQTLDWAGYQMADGYPQKLRFGEGWLVLAYQR